MPDFQKVVRERLGGCQLSPVREAEIADEIAQHLRDRYESLLVAGASAEDAERAVVAELNARDLEKELRAVEKRWTEPVALGAEGGTSFWASLWQDVRYAARVLRLNPGFTAVCVISLALGIGANTAIFQLIDAVRMRTLPVQHPEQLAVIRLQDTRRTGEVHGPYAYLTTALWEQIRARQQGFSGVFAFGERNFNLSTGGQARFAQGLWVSGDFFNVLGIEPILGRILQPSDDRRRCGAPGAVISYAFWQREFGGDPAIVGKNLNLDGQPFPILGVTPASFFGVEIGHSFDVAVPICSEPLLMGKESLLDVPHGWWLAAMGRLKAGWSLERAAAQLQTISPAIMQETLPPAYQAEDVKWYLSEKVNAYPGATGVSDLRRHYESPLWLLLAIAGLVLLIACANLANLMLARASAREREIAVRLALGAARARLVRQLLTESLLIAFAGAVLGAVLAGGLSRFLIDYLSGESNVNHIFVNLSLDWRVLMFASGLALLTCVLFGLAPALRATTAAPARIISLAGRGLTATRERFSLRRALVVVQVALSLVLVVSALLFTRSLRKILTIDPGFQRDGLLVMPVDLRDLRQPPAQLAQTRDELLERVRHIPGVESAASTSIVPLSGNGWNDRVVVNGQVAKTWVDMNNVSPGFFKTMGTSLLAGRDFGQNDNADAPKVAIVNQEFARKILGAENPIGHTFGIEGYKGTARREYQIVGLVQNTKYNDIREQSYPIAYYPEAQEPELDAGPQLIVRSQLPLDSLLASLRKTVADVNPALVVSFSVLNRTVNDTLLRERLLALLSGFFGILAAVLATVGLYGVIAYMVARRTNEIGIRMALGAAPGSILAMILREAAGLLAVGVIVGTVLALAAGKSASTLLFGLKPYDPATLVAACVGLGVVALAASLIPARRASRLEPTAALREE